MKPTIHTKSESSIWGKKYLKKKKRIIAYNDRLRDLIINIRIVLDMETVNLVDIHMMYQCFDVTKSVYSRIITNESQNTLNNVINVETLAISKITAKISNTLIVLEEIFPRFQKVESIIKDFILKENVLTEWSYEIYLCFYQIVNSQTLDDILSITNKVTKSWTSEIIASCLGYNNTLDLVKKWNSDNISYVVGKYVVTSIDTIENIAKISSMKFYWKQDPKLCNKPFNKIPIRDIKRCWRQDSRTLFDKVMINDEVFDADHLNDREYYSLLLEKVGLKNDKNIISFTVDEDFPGADLLKLTTVTCVLAANDYLRRLYPSLFPGIIIDTNEYIFCNATSVKCYIVKNEKDEYVLQRRKGEIYSVLPRRRILGLNITWKVMPNSKKNSRPSEEPRINRSSRALSDSEESDSNIRDTTFANSSESDWIGVLELSKVKTYSCDLFDMERIINILNNPMPAINFVDLPRGIEYQF